MIRKPNFIIIGSAKCGTTSLASILDNHPDCCMSRPKEISYFQDTVGFKPNPNYAKGWEWYHQAFLHYAGEKMVGEATPAYSDRSRSPNTAKRIFEFNPEMKIIYMVRNPVERQISGWKMQYYHFHAHRHPDIREEEWANNGIEYWLQRQKEAHQWDVCKYDYQLDAYRAFFDEEQICVSFLEDWKINQTGEVSRILNFLELQEQLTPEQLNKRENSEGVRTERNSVKIMKSISYFSGLKAILPYRLKKKILDKLGKRELVYPEIPKGALKEFINYVKRDADNFLQRYNKPRDFWNLNM